MHCDGATNNDSGESTMSATTLAQRPAALEKRLGQLEALVAKMPQPPDWRSTLGMFSGDEAARREALALYYRMLVDGK